MHDTENWRAEKDSWTPPITNLGETALQLLKKTPNYSKVSKILRSIFQSVFALAAFKSQGLLSSLCLTLLILQSLKLRQSLQEASWMMPPRKIHMLSRSSSWGIYPSLIAEIDTHSTQSKHVTLQERAMDVECLYLWGNENGEKLGFWLLSTAFLCFKCLPRLCCTSAYCITLDLQSSVFSINLQRNYWKALCIT